MAMNPIIIKMLFVGLALLSTACAHYPQQYSYYPGYGGYSSEYTIMHRNYYGERPDYYDHGGAYFPHHRQHDQYDVPHRRNNDYSEHHQHHRSHDYSFNYENRDDGRHNNFNHRNYR